MHSVLCVQHIATTGRQLRLEEDCMPRLVLDFRTCVRLQSFTMSTSASPISQAPEDVKPWQGACMDCKAKARSVKFNARPGGYRVPGQPDDVRRCSLLSTGGARDCGFYCAGPMPINPRVLTLHDCPRHDVSKPTTSWGNLTSVRPLAPAAWGPLPPSP